MVSFDNRYNLNVEHIWLIKGNENIETNIFNKKLNERTGFSIMNNEKSFKKYIKYEIVDKLEKVQKACVEFKNNITM